MNRRRSPKNKTNNKKDGWFGETILNNLYNNYIVDEKDWRISNFNFNNPVNSTGNLVDNYYKDKIYRM